MNLTVASVFGMIMLVGGTVALFEYRLVRFYVLWLLPAYGLAVVHFGPRIGPENCGTSEGLLNIFCLFLLGGYVLASILQQARNLLRGAA